MELSSLPTLNAVLNSTSAILLTTGYVLIRRRRVTQHLACMLVAFVSSTLFLISYPVYHANVGSVAFAGQGNVRVVYLSILISRVVLAAVILPLALVS